jgi:lactoylglutathione lyase
MRDYRYDHVHLRSPDPEATARFFETMFGAEITRSIYPPGTLYPGQQRITAGGRHRDNCDTGYIPMTCGH